MAFDESNLRHMRNFYLVYPKCDALRPELKLDALPPAFKGRERAGKAVLHAGNHRLQLEYENAERQIGNLYYERMLMSHNTQIVKDEAAEKKSGKSRKTLSKTLMYWNFLGLKDNTDFRENELEQAIIDKLQNFFAGIRQGLRAFVGRQYRLTTDTGKHFYADLVFFITIYSNSF